MQCFISTEFADKVSESGLPMLIRRISVVNTSLDNINCGFHCKISPINILSTTEYRDWVHFLKYWDTGLDIVFREQGSVVTKCAQSGIVVIMNLIIHDVRNRIYPDSAKNIPSRGFPVINNVTFNWHESMVMIEPSRKIDTLVNFWYYPKPRSFVGDHFIKLPLHQGGGGFHFTQLATHDAPLVIKKPSTYNAYNNESSSE